jgi:hypothetical protein
VYESERCLLFSRETFCTIFCNKNLQFFPIGIMLRVTIPALNNRDYVTPCSTSTSSHALCRLLLRIMPGTAYQRHVSGTALITYMYTCNSMLLVVDTLCHATLLPSVLDMAQLQEHPVGNKNSYYSTYNFLALVVSTKSYLRNLTTEKKLAVFRVKSGSMSTGLISSI